MLEHEDFTRTAWSTAFKPRIKSIVVFVGSGSFKHEVLTTQTAIAKIVDVEIFVEIEVLVWTVLNRQEHHLISHPANSVAASSLSKVFIFKQLT